MVVVEGKTYKPSGEFDSFDKKVITSDEFVQAYRSMMADLPDAESLSSYSFGESRADRVMNYLLDGLSGVDSPKEVYDLVNSYILAVEKDLQISSDDKQLLYNTFTVLVYSYNYWYSHENKK